MINLDKSFTSMPVEELSGSNLDLDHLNLLRNYIKRNLENN